MMTEADVRGLVMCFDPERPLIVGKRLHADLIAMGFLRDPEMAKRIRVAQLLPVK